MRTEHNRTSVWDRVLPVLHASLVRQDGQRSSLTAPNEDAFSNPFTASDGAPAIVMILASKRREIFEPMHLHDVDDSGCSKLLSFGPVAVHHDVEAEHTICCAACVS